MARPKLGDSESKRLQMVITEDELKAIEDWQFNNRVQSKSEAIRRLVHIALLVERALPSITLDVAEVLDLAAEGTDVPEAVSARIEAGELEPSHMQGEIAQRLFDNVNFTFNRQIYAQENLFDLLLAIAPFANNPDIEEALRLAEDKLGNAISEDGILREVHTTRRAQIEKWRKRRDSYRRMAKARMKRNSK